MKTKLNFEQAFGHRERLIIEGTIEVFEVALSKAFMHISSGDEFRRYDDDLSVDLLLLKFEKKVKQAIADHWMECSAVPGRDE